MGARLPELREAAEPHHHWRRRGRAEAGEGRARSPNELRSRTAKPTRGAAAEAAPAKPDGGRAQSPKRERLQRQNPKARAKPKEESSWDRRFTRSDSASGSSATGRASGMRTRRISRDLLDEDAKIRKFVKKKLYNAGVVAHRDRARREQGQGHHLTPRSRASSSAAAARASTTCASDLEQTAEGKQVHVNVQEIRTPELDAQLVAESIAQQIEKRISYKRAMQAGGAARRCAWAPRASRSGAPADWAARKWRASTATSTARFRFTR